MLIGGLNNTGQATRSQSSAGGYAGQVIFVHIPRTGGTTFRREILARVFERSEARHVKGWTRFNARLLEGPERLLYGHMNCPGKEDLPESEPTLLLSVVRDPVARAWSLYNRKCRQNRARFDSFDAEALAAADDMRTLSPSGKLPKASLAKFVRSNPTFEEFVRYYLPWRSRNEQSRILAGIHYPAPPDYSGQELLAAALGRVTEQPHIVGTTEALAEFIRACGEHLGWPVRARRSHNVSPRPQREIPPELADLIRSENPVDCDLHAICTAGG